MKVFGVCPRKIRRSNIDPAGNLVSEETSGLNYVMAVAQNSGHEIRVDNNSESIEDLVCKINEYDPDIIALSLDTCFVNAGKEIVSKANLTKKRISVVGGNHFLSGKVESPFDFAVIGEGESTFTELLEAIGRKKADYSVIKGISFFNKKRIVTTPRRERILDLDSIPHPYRGSDTADNRADSTLIHPIFAQQRGYASITASRGCRNSCSYCTSSTEWGNKVIHRSVENVIKEIEDIQRKFGTNLVFFNDLNFTSNQKWIIDFCNSIKNRGIELNWYGMSNISTADNPEMLKLMKKAGCVKLMYGIESLNEPRKYGTYEKAKRVLSLSEDAGIINHGFLMIGLPSDNYESIVQSIPLISGLPIHSIRVSTCTPFPGTKDYDHYPISNSLDLYDGGNLVFEHPSLTDGLCQELREKITKGFYSSADYTKRVKHFVGNNPHLKKSFEIFLGGKNV